jgi:hypothetical protein
VFSFLDSYIKTILLAALNYKKAKIHYSYQNKLINTFYQMESNKHTFEAKYFEIDGNLDPQMNEDENEREVYAQFETTLSRE